MDYKIEVFSKNGFFDAAAENIKTDIINLGIKNVKKVKVSNIYFIKGSLSKKQIKRIIEKLLADRVCHDYKFNAGRRHLSRRSDKRQPPVFSVEVKYKPGVTDSVGETALLGINDLGIKSVRDVRTGVKYTIYGCGKRDVQWLAQKLLANPVVQEYKLEVGC